MLNRTVGPDILLDGVLHLVSEHRRAKRERERIELRPRSQQG